ncbi:MAG: cupredoxin domain-containing protein, partial [Nitrosopumilus sp.]
DGNIVDHVNYDIFATQNSDSILSDPASHRHPGKYPIHESSALDDSLIQIQVVVQGLGHGDAIFGPKNIETTFSITPTVSSQTPTETVIKTADNSGMSMDCQTSLDCYTPSIVTVSVGDVVTMINSDSTAAMHSFTAGTVDGFSPSPSGTFDTGIMSIDDSFEWIPENAGEQPYYCMLHTWMQGTIIVE